MKELTSTISPPFLIFLLSNLIFSPSTAIDTLIQSQPLTDGKTLISADGSFALGFFGPDNSNNRYVGIWYNKVPTHTVIWVANRQHPIPDHTGILSISGDGILTISRRSNSTVIWSTAATAANPVAKLLDNGNLVVREATSGGRVAWQSFDHPSDTLLPGMKLGWDLKRGLNRYLTAWSTDSDPSPGPYTMAMDVQGDPEIYLRAGEAPVWRTGPWDGLRFSGIPDMETYSMFSFAFVADGDEVYYSYHVLDPSVVSRLIVNASGQTQRLVWLDSSRSWSVFWFAPKDPCDVLNPCGPNGVCNPNGSPICSCLQGFEPTSPENWALRDGSEGCVRRTAVDCRTDGFVTVSGTKPPETSRAEVDSSMTVDQCRAKCLVDCSCTAYASNDISGGGVGTGCIIWTSELTDIRLYTFAGQDLHVRLAAADLGSSSDISKKKGITAVAIVIGGFLSATLLGFIGYCVLREKKKKKRKVTVSFADNYQDQSAHGKDLELPLFDMVTIIVATDNFSIQNKLGEGGFGPVYKGQLQDGQEIAVKRLAKTSLQGMDEFKNEVMLLAKLQHRNLVRLLGCCIDGEEKMLVYEYMYNTSLDAFLFDKVKCAMLDWETRYKIILGIARGLLYLHQDSRLRIIHRDLKASNILLDKDMIPKISDFGMARIFGGGDETAVNTRKVVGTYGYMSPEYAMDGIFSVKSDVFSFGVLVIEILSGRRNRGIYLSERQQNLLGHAWNLWKEGNALELVDESMSSSFSMTEAFRCLKVGLLCVQQRPEDRPAMSSVVLMLGSEGASLPPPKEPEFVATRGGVLELDSSTSKQADSMTLNDISVTMTQGR